MAFKVSAKRHFKHTVTFPAADDGVEQSMDVSYHVLSDEELGSVNVLNVEETRAFLRKCIKNIDDLISIEGEPLKYSIALLDGMTVDPDVRNGLARGYGHGLAKVSAGN